MSSSPQDVPERYVGASPDDLLPIGVKQVLIHGTADPNVPYEISDLYVSRTKAIGDDAELIPLKSAGHFEIIDPMSKEWSVVREKILDAIPK